MLSSPAGLGFYTVNVTVTTVTGDTVVLSREINSLGEH